MLKKDLLVPVSAALLVLGALGLTAYADQGATPTQPPLATGQAGGGTNVNTGANVLSGPDVNVQSGLDVQDTSGTDATPEATAEAPESAKEAPESATETVEPGEPALPGGGHNDTGNANADNQFDGVQ